MNDPRELWTRALDVAERVLAARWARERFELVVEGVETSYSQILERPHAQVRVAVFETCGLVGVDLDARREVVGASARTPADFGDEPLSPLDDALVERVAAAAKAEALSRGAARDARVTVLGARPSRAGLRAVARAYVRGDDSVVAVDLDARSADVLGYHAAPFLRGSRGGLALSAETAVARVRASPDAPPPGARLARSTLEDGPLGRAWRLRFDVSDATLAGWIVITANARSGAVVGVLRALRPHLVLGPAPEPDRARLEAERAAIALLGPGARVATLVEGVLVGRPALGPRRGWLGVAAAPDGRVARVAVAQGEVEVALDGKIKRMPAASAPDVAAAG